MPPPTPKARIGLLCATLGKQHGNLWQALGDLYPVEFCKVEGGAYGDLDGLIVAEGDLAAGMAAAAQGIPSLVIQVAGEKRSAGVQAAVFGLSFSLDPYLRQQSLEVGPDTAYVGIATQTGDETVACIGGDPVWIVRPTTRASCQVVSVNPPVLKDQEYLFQHLTGRDFLALLPLLSFVREIAKGRDWICEPSAACYVFDDPNMHRRSYGYLDFERLIQHANEHNYFAAVATIPLDSWWVSRRVASTVSRAHPRLSILIHGNNHTTHEMLVPNQKSDFQAVAAQAMRRMERLTKNHGVQFQRVMEAPHGALAAGMLPRLLELGYEAALCTPALFVRHNLDLKLPSTFGFNQAEMLGGGLPVVPRRKMSPFWKNEVLLAAFLRQPIILAGHHYDAANDMDMMAAFAETVNNLPEIGWSDLDGILRRNYSYKVEGDLLKVKLHARRVAVEVPPGINRLQVHRAWISGDETEEMVVRIADGTNFAQRSGAVSFNTPVVAGTRVEIVSALRNPIHCTDVSAPAVGFWPLARKAAMEMRDRLSPMLPVVDRLRRRPVLAHR